MARNGSTDNPATRFPAKSCQVENPSSMITKQRTRIASGLFIRLREWQLGRRIPAVVEPL